MSRYDKNAVSVLRLQTELECANSLSELQDTNLTEERYRDACEKIDALIMLCACETLTSHTTITDESRLKAAREFQHSSPSFATEAIRRAGVACVIESGGVLADKDDYTSAYTLLDNPTALAITAVAGSGGQAVEYVTSLFPHLEDHPLRKLFDDEVVSFAVARLLCHHSSSKELEMIDWLSRHECFTPSLAFEMMAAGSFDLLDRMLIAAARASTASCRTSSSFDELLVQAFPDADPLSLEILIRARPIAAREVSKPRQLDFDRRADLAQRVSHSLFASEKSA